MTLHKNGLVVGSSPHTRGAQETRRPRRGEGRIIPAYAGSTRVWRNGCLRCWDHPRIRGEHVPAVDPCCWGAGSSPHTRGAPKKREDRENAARIIPAYAGSTACGRGMDLRGADHPRIRGEHYFLVQPSSGGGGSSPHTRGAPTALHLGPRNTGIIPAYAGSTPCSWAACPWVWDHPRIRGEHGRSSLAAPVEAGSSPHTRGAPRSSIIWRNQRRIIPAYAGST